MQLLVQAAWPEGHAAASLVCGRLLLSSSKSSVVHSFGHVFVRRFRWSPFAVRRPRSSVRPRIPSPSFCFSYLHQDSVVHITSTVVSVAVASRVVRSTGCRVPPGGLSPAGRMPHAPRVSCDPRARAICLLSLGASVRRGRTPPAGGACLPRFTRGPARPSCVVRVVAARHCAAAACGFRLAAA